MSVSFLLLFRVLSSFAFKIQLNVINICIFCMNINQLSYILKETNYLISTRHKALFQGEPHLLRKKTQLEIASEFLTKMAMVMSVLQSCDMFWQILEKDWQMKRWTRWYEKLTLPVMDRLTMMASFCFFAGLWPKVVVLKKWYIILLTAPYYDNTFY